jgi:hypothetical protein
LEIQNQLRREARKTEALAYREMKVAHANSIQAKYPIPTTPSGKVVGQHTKWHSVVCATGCSHAHIRLVHQGVQEVSKSLEVCFAGHSSGT